MKLKFTLKRLVFWCLAVSFAFTSCQKDDGPSNNNPNNENNIPDTFSEYFGNQMTRDFVGTVINKNNEPIAGVTITIGNETEVTDDNGVFIIRNAAVNERFGYIKTEKEGYIHGSRSVVPSNGTNKVTIMLLEANVVATVNSGTAETVTMTNGSSVSLDGNFIKEDGTEYSGSVDVIMHHLDPVDTSMPLQMPGMLYAENTDGAERMLQTLGMLAVELRGTAGEDLNLAAGSTSEIRIPVDASLLPSAPATIPLWYFDEINGYWKEEGQATLNGNFYIGTVSHFSFWNCDIPAEAVTLCVSVNDEQGNPLNNLYVTITSNTFGTRGGNLNDVGETCGFVPSEEVLELNVYGYQFCDDTPLQTEMIGPFTEDSSITITLNNSTEIISETVVGQFNTCNGNTVTDGYVQLTYGNETFTDVVTNGTFEINLLRCDNDNTFSVVANDYANLQSTGEINYTFNTPQTSLGILSACNDVEEFIQYTIDDQPTVILLDFINASFYTDGSNYNGPSLNISGSDNDNSCFYLFGVLNDSQYVGTYDNLDWNDIEDTGFNIQECLGMSSENNNITYNLTAIGEVGDYIDINFSGTYEDYEGNPHSITGLLHVLRDQ
ncbi:MAG: carboxypeptidase-like regulatory domain-containing protein [Winogradskyella sp.]|nr:carboxypeptidase-like regulatory domain-containing protein [Winogradskyella sp.]